MQLIENRKILLLKGWGNLCGIDLDPETCDENTVVGESVHMHSRNLTKGSFYWKLPFLCILKYLRDHMG